MFQSAYSESRGLVTDNSKAVTLLSDRNSRAEEDINRLSSQVANLHREKTAAEDECRDLRRQNDTLTRRSVADKDDLRRCQLLLQEADNKQAELKILVSSMESSSHVHEERNARLIAALRERSALYIT